MMEEKEAGNRIKGKELKTNVSMVGLGLREKRAHARRPKFERHADV